MFYKILRFSSRVLGRTVGRYNVQSELKRSKTNQTKMCEKAKVPYANSKFNEFHLKNKKLKIHFKSLLVCAKFKYFSFVSETF